MKKLLSVFILIVIAATVFFFYQRKNSFQSVSTGKSISIPEKVLTNKFGFLSGNEPKNPFVGDVGAAWVRPHPGPFLWDDMQKKENAPISFQKTDKLVLNQQKQNYGTLVTLWPFAEWDQLNHKNSENCKVSQNDEFLKQNDKKGSGDYLPLHRCNPTDWESYIKWVKAIVERYNGDGKNDMPGLKIPVKYWEIMNEPDLSFGIEDTRLSFYKEDASVYAELLIKTAGAIRAVDPNAKILIAGAAGADERFLNFYRDVLKNSDARGAFDIGNIHCISNDKGTQDFNMRAYKNMLNNFGLYKPIWVTEAEAFNGQTAEENYVLTKNSTAGAIKAGAERIFFTRYNFDDFRKDMSIKNEVSQESIKDSQQKYKNIIEQY